MGGDATGAVPARTKPSTASDTFKPVKRGRIGSVVAVACVLTFATTSIVAPASAGSKKYRNCAALNKDYRHGVGRSGAVDTVRGKTKPVTNFTRNTSLYNANTGRDGDTDGVACEKR